DRRKQGFAVPLESWFRSELSSKAHDLLMSDTCRSRNLFNQAYIGNMLARYRNGESQRLNSRLWTLISFELWCRKFLDEPAIRAGEQSSDEQENAWRFSAA
ncbi:MAG: asparagine synthase-related protein, partial [Pseudohongiellaceae bacterium]